MFRLAWYLGALAALGACGRLEFDDPLPGRPIPHVEQPPTSGTSAIILSGAVIDTTALTIDGQPPRGAVFVAVAPADGPGLAILQAHAFTFGDVRVIGVRALVVIARDAIVVQGLLDAGARGETSGPGALPIEAAIGTHEGVCDGGGAGAGHGTAGADGGASSCGGDGGTAGALYGDATLAILAGGSHGGAGITGNCGAAPGGGGGGAIQLSAVGRIHVRGSGTINVGGGGGAGGFECGDGDAGAGAGGGAGGSVYLDAPELVLAGVVVAHGGGGGGGGNGNVDNGPIGFGGDGADSTSLAVATGGAVPAPNGGTGGAGGTGAAPPQIGGTAQHNGGGGGGAVGRIVIRGAAMIDGTLSPEPTQVD